MNERIKRLVISFVAALLPFIFSAPVIALEAAVSLSSDLRGAAYLAESLYKGVEPDNPKEDQDGGASADGGSPELSNDKSVDLVEFGVRPSLHVEVAQQIYQQDRLHFSIKGEVVYASAGVRYPNGLSFQLGGRTVRFTEPSSLQLSSFDLGVGPVFRFELNPRMSVGGEIVYIYQRLSIQTVLGDWKLKDTLYDHRFDHALWIDYRVGNKFFTSLQPFLRFGLTYRQDEASLSLAARFSF